MSNGDHIRIRIRIVSEFELHEFVLKGLNVYHYFSLTDDYYKFYYYVTHTRLAPWLIGIALGATVLKNPPNRNNIFVKNQVNFN